MLVPRYFLGVLISNSGIQASECPGKLLALVV